MANKETNISTLMRIELSRHFRGAIVLFRNNVGRFWSGRITSQKNGITTLQNARLVVCGFGEGSSDQIGFSSIQITQEMVGKNIAIFTAIEIKSKSVRVTDEQLKFLKFIESKGGIALVYRDGQNIVELIKTRIDEIQQ